MKFLFVAVFAFLLFGSAIESKAAVVRIDNYKNEKVKVCLYRSSDKTWLKPIKCYTLNRRQTVSWDQGRQQFNFDVRVFRPGIVDKRLCQIRGLKGISRLYINPRNPCITYQKRKTAPPAASVPIKSWQRQDKVLARWAADGLWYPATIVRSDSGNYYYVEFRDKSVSRTHAKHISGDHVGNGTKVFGNWKSRGRYYPGQITSRNGETIRIYYNDDDVETTTMSKIRIAFKNLPKAPVRYMMRVCNRSVNERVYFSIAFAVSAYNHMSEGWWYVNKNGCVNIDLRKRWKKAGVPDNLRSRTYIYGETKGSFGGVVKKVWEGSDSRFSFCINENKTKYFKNFLNKRVNGRYVKNSCSASGKEVIKMNHVKFPATGTLSRWNF